MSAKEYLGEIRRLTAVIDSYQRSIDILRSDIEGIRGISYDKDRVQSTASDSTILNQIIRLEELAGKMGDVMIERAKKRAEITSQITLMPNRNYMQILFKRYVEFKKFELIAVEMGYSYDYVRELHGQALDEFGKKYGIK